MIFLFDINHDKSRSNLNQQFIQTRLTDVRNKVLGLQCCYFIDDILFGNKDVRLQCQQLLQHSMVQD